MTRPILWSCPCSAFSGKLRSYLVKAGIDHDERFASQARFHQEIVPRIGYLVVPVLELGDGTLMQDSTLTMLHLDANAAGARRLVPPMQTPVRHLLAHLLNFMGSDGFLKPGMHYRWTYLEEQRQFFESEFLEIIPDDLDPTERRQRASAVMEFFQGYCPKLGISADTVAAIEASWGESLTHLDGHFSAVPYLLGDVPTIADCGLMTMVYAHLYRDPVAGRLMKTRAPRVTRWVERMNQAGVADGGFPRAKPDHPDLDEIPDSLLPFLRYLFTDVAPEVIATLRAYRAWIEKSAALQSGDPLDDASARNAHPPIGEIEYRLRGTVVRRHAFVDTVFQFQQVMQIAVLLPAADQARFRDFVGTVGGHSLLEEKTGPCIKYETYRYWLA